MLIDSLNLQPEQRQVYKSHDSLIQKADNSLQTMICRNENSGSSKNYGKDLGTLLSPKHPSCQLVTHLPSRNLKW